MGCNRTLQFYATCIYEHVLWQKSTHPATIGIRIDRVSLSIVVVPRAHHPHTNNLHRHYSAILKWFYVCTPHIRLYADVRFALVKRTRTHIIKHAHTYPGGARVLVLNPDMRAYIYEHQHAPGHFMRTLLDMGERKRVVVCVRGSCTACMTKIDIKNTVLNWTHMKVFVVVHCMQYDILALACVHQPTRSYVHLCRVQFSNFHNRAEMMQLISISLLCN